MPEDAPHPSPVLTSPDAGQIPAGSDGASLVGHQIGDYALIRQIRGGGMAWVYEATSKKWPRRLVVKIPAGGRLASAEARQRFEREIRAVTELSHPNIVAVLDYGHFEAMPFMVMNLVEGQPLADWLAEENPAIGVRLIKFNDLCNIVAAVHREGKLHRDLKPGNIVVDKHGELRLLDFGLARPLEDLDDLTAENARLGTPNCMAPEQASGSRNVGAAADVYSLGVILHWLLAGCYPIMFDGITDEERYLAIQHRPPTKPGAWNKNVPAPLDDLVARCLEKSPARRPADSADLRAQLEQALKETEAAVAPWAQTKVPRHSDAANPGQTTAFNGQTSLVESAGGAVPLKSPYYVERRSDTQFLEAVARSESVILVHGPRQIGKTSLLARGLSRIRQGGRKVILVDFQAINAEVFQSLKSLYFHFAAEIADQLGLPGSISELWDENRSANSNFERFLTRKVLPGFSMPLVWVMDEVDRLFSHPYSSELFGMMRSWHNARALNPAGPWSRVTLALAYATEAKLFITDLNQSPFNIGVRLDMADFEVGDLVELNRRHQEPLSSLEEIQRLHRLVGGHPFLVRVAFNYLVREQCGIDGIEGNAVVENGPFEAHLRHAAGFVMCDPSLAEAVKSIQAGKGCASGEAFYQLRSAGLAGGNSPRQARFRCALYDWFFRSVTGDGFRG